MMRTRVALACLLLWAAAGCGRKETVSGRVAVPALAELKNLTYTKIAEMDPVTLEDGRWEGEPFVAEGASRPAVQFVRDFRLMGDLDGDGLEEAAVLLGAGSGGTGQNIYLAVVGIRDGKPENLDTVLLGDRVQVRQAGILEGRIYLDVLRAGPRDAMCCPGELAQLGWSLKNGQLAALDSVVVAGRLSLETVGGTDWVLRWWSWEEQAPADPEVTLFFENGRLGGTSGCNNYFATVNIGGQPGEISLGPLGGTMKMCPEETMVVEQRYLSQMGGVKKFGFMAGMLALTWDFDGKGGIMLFEPRDPR